MSSCRYSNGAPPLNSDISGVGVRLSFYFQTLFLGFLSARSGTLHEIAGALYTLMATNTAMAVTGLILGLKPTPEVTLQDALITLYLLTMSWLIVIGSLSSCNRLSDDTQILQFASLIQGYAILAFAFAILAAADGFGYSPECNQNAVAVIFRPFSAMRSGRILGWIVVSLVFVCYTAMNVRDYTAKVLKKFRAMRAFRNRKVDPTGHGAPVQQHNNDFASPGVMAAPPVPDLKALREKGTFYGVPRPLIDPELLFMLGFILLFWVFFVLHTELVIHWNQVARQWFKTQLAIRSGAYPLTSLTWTWISLIIHQILPMFLSILPFINMVSVFNQFGIKPTQQVDKTVQVKVAVIYDRGF